MALTQHQLTELGQQLKARHQQLGAEIRAELARSDEAHYGDLAGQVHDRGDEAIADLLVDIDLATIDRQINEIRAIEAAQQRLLNGSYGTCADCGVEIGIERLRRQPTAARCVSCQAQLEKSQPAGAPARL